MSKVLYNGEYIELEDELEPGYKELDLLTEVKPENSKSEDLEATKELKPINLEDTLTIKYHSLEDTQELDLGDLNE